MTGSRELDSKVVDSVLSGVSLDDSEELVPEVVDCSVDSSVVSLDDSEELISGLVGSSGGSSVPAVLLDDSEELDSEVVDCSVDDSEVVIPKLVVGSLGCSDELPSEDWSVGSVGSGVVTVVLGVVNVVSGGRFVGLVGVPDPSGKHTMSLHAGYLCLSSNFSWQFVVLQTR